MQAISAQFLFQARRFEEAKERALFALAIDGNFWVAHMMLGQALERLHETEAAIDAADKAFKLSGGNTLPLALRGYTLATTGRRDEALQLVRVMQVNSSRVDKAIASTRLRMLRIRSRTLRFRPPDVHYAGGRTALVIEADLDLGWKKLQKRNGHRSFLMLSLVRAPSTGATRCENDAWCV